MVVKHRASACCPSVEGERMSLATLAHGWRGAEGGAVRVVLACVGREHREPMRPMDAERSSEHRESRNIGSLGTSGARKTGDVAVGAMA